MPLAHKDFVHFNQSIQQYKLIELLNEGGMGYVYLAEDTRLKRQVAIKLFKADPSHPADVDIKSQTLKEAQLLARLNHPNIVQIHDVLLFGEFVCIVMEYLKGKTLQQFQQQHVMTLTQKLTILTEICGGLSHAHNQNVLHCDLKPSNILIDQNNTKITDFGISQLTLDTEEKPKTEQSSYGSLTAMSPEQLKGQSLTLQSDLFSFGMLAFELIAGHHPFGKGSQQSISKNIIETKSEDALQFIPKLPTELALLLNQLLEKDIDKRPSDAQTVHKQLEAILVALTQQSILDQETQMFDPSDSEKSRVFNWKSKLLASAFAVSLVSGIYGYFHFSSTPERYVAFLPPTIEVNDTQNTNIQLLTSTIDEAIRQSIVNNKKLNLIPRSEINAIVPNVQVDLLNKDSLEKIHQATGAEEIVTANLTCKSAQCSLILERLVAPNWTVKQRQQWPVVTDSYSYLYSSTRQQFSTLFPNIQDTYLPLSDINEEVLQEHLALYQAIVIDETYTQELMERTKQLIITAPNFYANYDLLREVTLGVYADSQNEDDLTNAKKVLFNASLNYQATPSFIYNSAMFSITGHEWELAENYIEKARQTGASPYIINELKGTLYFHKDDLEKAQQAFEVALQLRPNNVTKELLATVLWWQGEAAQARELLESILSIAPKAYVANQLLADIALFEGDLNTAINGYTQALAIQPDAIDYSHLSMAYSLQKDFVKALNAIEKAVNYSPENKEFLLNLADIKKANGLTAEAFKDYQKVISLSNDPENFDDLLNIAQAYSQIKAPKEALIALNAAINISQDNGEYIFTAALVYSLIGEYQSALLYIEKSLEAGYHPMWFSLPWFNHLCSKKEFTELMEQHNSPLICLEDNYLREENLGS